MKGIRQRPVRSSGSGRTDQMMWVVWLDKDGDGRTKMGTNPDTFPLGKSLEDRNIKLFYLRDERMVAIFVIDSVTWLTLM